MGDCWGPWGPWCPWNLLTSNLPCNLPRPALASNHLLTIHPKRPGMPKEGEHAQSLSQYVHVNTRCASLTSLLSWSSITLQNPCPGLCLQHVYLLIHYFGPKPRTGRASGSSDRALKQEQIGLRENHPDHTARAPQTGTREPKEKTHKSHYHGGVNHKGTPFGNKPQTT